MTIIRVVKFLFVLLLFPALGWAVTTNYYVSAAGSNTSPYDTWAKGATSLASIRALSLSGDVTINLRPGDDFSGGLECDNWHSMTAFTLKSTDCTSAQCGADREVADEGNASITGGEYSHGGQYASHLLIEGITATVTITNVDFTGQDFFTSFKAYAVNIRNSTAVTITGCTGDGQVGTTDNVAWRYNGFLQLVQNNGTNDISGNTIQYWGPPCLWATPATPTCPGPTCTSYVKADYNAIIVQSTVGTYNIHDNTFTNIDGDGVATDAYGSSCTTAAVNIYDNTFHNTGENSIDNKGGDNMTAYRNYAYRDATFTGLGGGNASNFNYATYYQNPEFQILGYCDSSTGDGADSNAFHSNRIGPTDKAAFGVQNRQQDITNTDIYDNYVYKAFTGLYLYESVHNLTDFVYQRNLHDSLYSVSGKFIEMAYGAATSITGSGISSNTFYTNTDSNDLIEIYQNWPITDNIIWMNDLTNYAINVKAGSPTITYNAFENAAGADEQLVYYAGKCGNGICTESEAESGLGTGNIFLEGTSVFTNPSASDFTLIDGSGAEGAGSGVQTLWNANTTLPGLGITVSTYASYDDMGAIGFNDKTAPTIDVPLPNETNWDNITPDTIDITENTDANDSVYAVDWKVLLPQSDCSAGTSVGTESLCNVVNKASYGYTNLPNDTFLRACVRVYVDWDGGSDCDSGEASTWATQLFSTGAGTPVAYGATMSDTAASCGGVPCGATMSDTPADCGGVACGATMAE